LETTAAVVGIVGGLLGATALLWRVLESFLAYLNLEMTVEQIEAVGGGRVTTALIGVDNRGRVAKHVHYAALLVGPAGEGIGATARRFGVGSDRPGLTHSLLLLFEDRPELVRYSADGMAVLVPLPGVYREQTRVGTETVRERVLLDTSKLAAGQVYRVVLLVAARYPFGVLRYRMTSDLLAVGSRA